MLEDVNGWVYAAVALLGSGGIVALVRAIQEGPKAVNAIQGTVLENLQAENQRLIDRNAKLEDENGELREFKRYAEDMIDELEDQIRQLRDMLADLSLE